MSAKHPNTSHIQKYLNGELDAKAMHQLERQAHNDPFLMEALEGHHATGTNHQSHMDDLQGRLASRIATNDNKCKVILWWVLPAAALILVVMVVGLLWLSPKHVQKQDAVNKTVIKPGKPIALKADTSTSEAQQMAKAIIAKTSNQQAVIQPQHIAINTHRTRHNNTMAVADVDTKRIGHKSVAEKTLHDTAAPVNQTVQQAITGMAPSLDITTGPPKITGYVTDTMGHPLASVKVYLKSSDITTVTDANGVFTINPTSLQQTLNIDYAGYDSKQVALNTKDKLHITLNESAVALPEISIPSHSDVKYTGLAKAQPLDGWKSYRAYIRKNAVMPDGETGKVKLIFTVRTDGSISNIKIIKGRTDAMNLKAIDLIKNGPEWHGDMEAREIKLKIKFHKSRKV